MAGVLQHLRSSTLNKRPNPASMVDGQIAINYASGSPGAFFKDTNGNLVKVGPVHVGATAPNVSPASGGTAGNSLGEQWLDTSGGTYVFKIWDGAAWRSEAGEFVNSTGDTMTGSLTMGPSANLIFEGSTDDGFETTLTVVDPTADRTITLPNVSGTVVTTGDSGTVTSTMIADGTIVNADVNASAAIAGTKISPDFGSQTIQTTGVFSHAVGSAGAPTIAFTGDTNTGIYSPGADQVAISTGGSGRLFVDASGNVGVATGAPSYRLEVNGTISQSSQGTSSALIQAVNAGGIFYHGLDNSAGTTFGHAYAAALWHSGAYPILFATNGTERLRITSAGLVGIGTSSPTTNVHIGSGVGGADLGVLLSRGATTNFFEAHDGTKNFIAGTDSSNAFVKVGSLTNHPVAIVQSNAAAIYIDTSKRVGIGTTSPSAELDVRGGANVGDGTTTVRTVAASGVGFIGTSTNHPLAFRINNGETARIDTSGRLLVGTSSARGIGRLQIEGTDFASSQIAVTRNSNDASESSIVLNKTRGTGVGGTTIVNSGDTLGVIYFTGSDGTNPISAAAIGAVVDGTPGANDMPGRLVFSTTADGASSPTERMRIDSNGRTTAKRNTNGGATLVAHNTANTSTDEGLQVLLESSAIVNTASFITCAQNNVGNRFIVLGTGNVQNTNNSYAGISDVKLKENIADSASQWDDIKALRVRNYNFKVDPSHRQIGLIAQEVETVSPGLVVETPDRDTDGNDLGTTTKSVQYSVLYMKAVKALQEAMERIETLEASNADLLARVTALENV